MDRPPIIALLSVGEAAPGAIPPGLLTVAGRTVVERQARQAVVAGATRLLVVAADLPARVVARLAAILPLVQAPDAAEAARHLADHRGLCLAIEPGIVPDDRIVAGVAGAEAGACLAVFSATPPPGAVRLDQARHFAGVVALPIEIAAVVLADHGEWEPVETLARTAAASGAAEVAVESIPLYAERSRRELPLLWERAAPGRERAIERRLLGQAQKSCLDWPARFLHPPAEDALVRLLWPTPVTPNMVTLATALIGFVALGLFATGHLLAGLLLVLLVGPLDGVDGKLARTRSEFSKVGDLEHVLDKVLEYGWFLALAWWFATTGHGLAAWLAAGGIILAALLEAVQGEYFRRFTGRQLDDWGPFERRFRLVGGRRNTFFWTLLPFGLAGLWWPGFLMILAYALLTALVSEWRFLRALGQYARQEAPAVRRNFEGSAYAFLPSRHARSS
jgi:phosphatidylglycerophosphate synthase